MGKFRAGNSPVHRLSAGWKMFLTVLLSAAAFSARRPLLLVALFLINGGYYFLAKLRLKDLWRDIRLFLLQTIIVVALYLIKDGVADGLWPGIRTGLQVLLFFLPGAVFLRTTQASQIMRSLEKIMPRNMAFFTFTSFRFIPFFAREMREIAMAQRLRGARLEPRNLVNPKNWPDIFHCLIIPLIIRALKTAQEAALSAEARGFEAAETKG
ncbi:MAG: energy-coupling factor transporter transmembrane protein EcfT [Deltaproteobacteria bacterium]|nr:energy-coupling factor transporter transmembrane protein EcfT [Deltaproteobacteria bacterium]